MITTESNNSKLSFYARIGLILHAFILTLFILYLGRLLFIPLFFALLIAILLYPLCKIMERRVNIAIAALGAILVFLLFLGLILLFLVREILLFVKDFPQTQDKMIDIMEKLRDWFFDKLNVSYSDQVGSIRDSFHALFLRFYSSIGSTFINVVEGIVLFAFFIIFTYFILLHRKMLVKFVLSFFNSAQKTKVNKVIENTRHVIVNYVIGLLAEMGILFSLLFVILLLLGVKYALLIAVIAALLNIIPYLGIYCATALGILIALSNGTGNMAIEVGITFLAVHFLDANVVMPKIVGHRVKINPLITMVAVVAGNLVWGIPGMFLFIPMVAIIRIISENVHDLKPWAILIGEGKKDS